MARFLSAEQDELRNWKRSSRPPAEALHLMAELLKHELLKKYGQAPIRQTRTK